MQGKSLPPSEASPGSYLMTTGAGGARVTWGDLQVPGATEGLSEVEGHTLAVCFY